MTDGGFCLCVTETLSTLRRRRLFCLLTKTKLKYISEDCCPYRGGMCFEVSYFYIVLIISNEESTEDYKTT